jgi:hypothetical protein
MESGRLFEAPFLGQVWIPDFVGYGFMVATFCFAAAYLTSRLQAHR